MLRYLTVSDVISSAAIPFQCSKCQRQTERMRARTQANILTLVTNLSPPSEMFDSQNVQLDHVRRVCVWV